MPIESLASLSASRFIKTNFNYGLMKWGFLVNAWLALKIFQDIGLYFEVETVKLQYYKQNGVKDKINDLLPCSSNLCRL